MEDNLKTTVTRDLKKVLEAIDYMKGEQDAMNVKNRRTKNTWKSEIIAQIKHSL